MGKWLSIGVTLIIVWVLGWLVFKVASVAIHLLLLAGLAFLVISLFRKAASTRTPRPR
jgi:positive regulator of sigma E activity